MSHVNRISVFVFVSAVITSLTLIAAPARAVSVGFGQVDWGDGSGGYEDQNSQWGQATIGLDATDAGSLTSDGAGGLYGYVNIVTTVGGGSNNNWAVQNMLVAYNSLGDLVSGQGATTIDFDLGQADGTDITNLNYSLTLTSAPLGLQPVGPLTNAVVATSLVVEGTSTDLSMPGDEAATPAADYVGAGVGTAPSRGSSGSISTNERCIPTVSESLNGCAPGSAARSLAYLASTGAINLTNSSAMNVRPGLGTEGLSGTNSQFARGKNAYIASNGLNVANTAFTNTPLFAGFFGLGTNSGSFAGAISALRSNGDVEVYLSWGQTFVRTNGTSNPPLGTNVVYGAHQAFVTGLIPNTNAAGDIVSYTLRYIDDHQQNGAGTNFFNERTFLPNGQEAWTTNTSIAFRGVVGFFIENVTQVPEPSTIALAVLGLGALGFSLSRRSRGRRRTQVTCEVLPAVAGEFRLRLQFLARQISSACLRLMVLVFLKWRGNVPSRISVMKLDLTLLAVVLAAVLSTPAYAQVLKPLDPNKKVDINDKTLNYGNVSFDTLSQPTRDLSGSSLSKGNLKFQDTDQEKAEFNTLGMSTISRPTLPQANFTTRRAAVDVPNDEARKQADQTKKQADQTKKKAQINGRQIPAFTPAGEKDLKHQLNEPPLGAH